MKTETISEKLTEVESQDFLPVGLNSTHIIAQNVIFVISTTPNGST